VYTHSLTFILTKRYEETKIESLVT